MTASEATPGMAAPGKAVSRGARRKTSKPSGQRMCPICGVNPLGEDEAQCPACAEKQMMQREGLHVGRNWLILIVAFALLVLAGKWVATLV